MGREIPSPRPANVGIGVPPDLCDGGGYGVVEYDHGIRRLMVNGKFVGEPWLDGYENEVSGQSRPGVRVGAVKIRRKR